MQIIIDTIKGLWDNLLPAVPQNIIDCLTALTLILLIYIVFVRTILLLCRASSLRKMMDIVLLVVCVCTIIYYIPPSININKFLTEVTEALS